MGLMVLNGAVEALGVASILPLLAVLNNPTVVDDHRGLQWVLTRLAGGSTTRLPIVLAVLTLGLLLLNSAIRISTEYAVSRFVERQRHSLSTRLLAGWLGQPWAHLLHRNAADLSRTILIDVGSVTQHVLQPGLRIPVYALVAVSLVAVLLLVNPATTLIAGMLVVGTYVAADRLSRHWLGRQGAERHAAHRDMTAAVSQALGGLKTLTHLGRGHEFTRRFTVPSAAVSRYQAAARAAGVIPRYVVEAVAVGSLVLVLLVGLGSGVPLADVLPLMGLYAFAGYRLIPAVQQIFVALTQIQFGRATLNAVVAEMQQLPQERPTADDAPAAPTLQHTLTCERLSVRYPGAATPALADVSFEVHAGELVALIGNTGAGKSTLVDVLLGLLPPEAGTLRIDGRTLSADEVRRWGRSVGHVPQHPYLADDSVLANVTFGQPPEDRDVAAVERALAEAGLATVVSQLPQTLETRIGDHGQRLSGGERQRLALARALYGSPSMLVLDEATSALDGQTAHDILTRLRALSPRPTILMVSHDPTLLVYADRVIRLQAGRVVPG